MDDYRPTSDFIDRLNARSSKDPSKRERRLLTIDELEQLPPPEWSVRDFIRKGGHNFLFGPPGAGKSVLALDWCLCIASGLPWFGQEVQPGPVVYIAAEGVFGLFQRIAAWCEIRGVERPANFRVYPEAVNFYAGDTAGLVAELQELEEPPVLIVVDTVSRCSVGGDENLARDANLYIENSEQTAKAFGAGLLSIHHTGKNGELERGSSAFRGAVDTMVSLKPEGAGLKISCEKQKDAAEFEPWRVHLAEVEESVSIRLGTDAERLAPQELQILEAVSASFGTDWTSATKIIEVSEVPKTSVYRTLQSLCGRGFLDEDSIGKQRKQYRVTPLGLEAVPNLPNRSHGTVPKPSHPSPLPKSGTGDGKAEMDPTPDDPEDAMRLGLSAFDEAA